MSSLPSYEEAVTSSDWLSLVASSIPVRHHSSLCLVSRTFYHEFVQRLWNDPLQARRLLHPDRSEDLAWYFRFIFKHCPRLRPQTRALVTSLDFRGFAASDYRLYSNDSEQNVSESLRHVPSLFPNLRCILLDNHPDFNPDSVARPLNPDMMATSPFGPPLMLSIADCHAQIPARFFSSDYLENIAYLDISDAAGSLKTWFSSTAEAPSVLPNLRILKARRREINDSAAALLLRAFSGRIWSLDLSENNLTDGMLDDVIRYGFAARSLRSSTQFYSEGKIVYPLEAGSDSHGPFKFIQESRWSGTFSHPERFFMDTPIYYQDADRLHETTFRAHGRTRVRRDDVEYVKTAVSGGLGKRIPGLEEVQDHDVMSDPQGITHLHLNSNEKLTSTGIQRMIRLSPGQLEHFECDTVSMELPRLPKWLSSAKLYGMAGIAHIFRPVWSSNLRVLRVHHSIVTQIPTLQDEKLGRLTQLWIAEMVLRPRIELAFPEVFVPDMNPRLYSLALTRLPRYSTGPLIDKLINLLRLAAIQERAIQNSAMSSSRRSPSLLKGLRHIRLEFEEDSDRQTYSDRQMFSSVSSDLDAADLLSKGVDDFSFFGDESWTGSCATRKAREQEMSSRPVQTTAEDPEPPGRFTHFPYSDVKDGGEHISHAGSWNGNVFAIPVWIGPGVVGPHKAVNEYMQLLRERDLHADVGPATPAHVSAGVPTGSYIFYAAWNAMLAPADLRPPPRAGLNEMHDVLAAVKLYRAQTRTAYETASKAAGPDGAPLAAPHNFWTGRLEVSLKEHDAYSQSAKYWR